MTSHRVRMMRVAIPIVVGLLALVLFTQYIGGDPLRAAPLLRAYVDTDPAIEAITLTAGADVPISDTHPYQGIDRTIYFNNDVPGVITLTFAISGTPHLTLTPGTAFGDSPAAISSGIAPWYPVVTYNIGTDESSYTNVAYTVVNSGYQTTTQVVLDYVQDITAPVVSILHPPSGYFTGTSLLIEGTSEDNPGGSGVRQVQVTTDTVWSTANGTTSWDYLTSFPTADGVSYTISVRAEDYLGTWSPIATRVITVDNSPPSGPPVFTPSLPIEQWVTVATLSMMWGGFNDNHEIVGYQYLVTDSVMIDLPGAGGQFTTVPSATETLEDGASYFHVAAQDVTGQWSSTYYTGAFWVDTANPTSTVTWSPDYENGTTFSMTWEAGDVTSSISETCLLYQFESTGSWTETGDCASDNTGTFVFTPSDGDGTYYFQTIAQDVAGNVEEQGLAEEQTIHDTVAPRSSIDIFPASEYTNAAQIEMGWYAFDLPDLSGVRQTCLWVKFNQLDWSNTGTCLAGQTGFFTYTFDQGDGTYYFQSIAEDNAGNVENLGIRDQEIFYDSIPPTSSVTAPTYAITGTIPVTWIASDTGSGVVRAYLWYKFGTDGVWMDSGEQDTGTSGVFNFTPPDGDGTYYFQAVAEDDVGNVQDEPTGDGQAQTIYDTVDPESNITQVPQYDGGGDVPVEWTAFDATSLVAETCLWYKLESDGTWSESAECATGNSGTFNLTPPGGANGTYYFQTVAEDNAGNKEQPPEGDSQYYTVYDTEPPTSVTVHTPEHTADSQFPVSWDADDATSGIVSFTVEYSGALYSDWQWFTTTSAFSATFTAEYAETTYLFRVTAYDYAGNSASEHAETFVGVFRIYLPLILRDYDPLANGSFENGLSGWNVAMAPLPVSTVSAVQERPSGSTPPSDGERALLLGNPNYGCSGVPLGFVAVEQSFTVPSHATSLTFDYIIWTQDASPDHNYDRFEVYVNGVLVDFDGNQLNEGLSCETWRRVPGPDNPRGGSTTGWATGTIPLDGYQGENITLSFRNYSRYDNWYNTYTYIDNVEIHE